MNKKKIIITGGSSGIGEHLVNSFLNDGHHVTCISRSIPKIKSKNLKNIKCDLSNLELSEKKIKRLLNFKFDVLINNAGDLGEIGKLRDINFKKWCKSFNLNLFVHTLITKLTLKLIKPKKGVIIFISGGGSATPFPGFSAYSLAKTSLVRLTENLSYEEKKIKFYIIAPGPNNTKILKKSLSNGHHVDKKKIVTPDLTKKLCDFLIKKKPAYLNGKFIHVKDDYKQIKNRIDKNYLCLRRVETK